MTPPVACEGAADRVPPEGVTHLLAVHPCILRGFDRANACRPADDNMPQYTLMQSYRKKENFLLKSTERIRWSGIVWPVQYYLFRIIFIG